VNTNNGVKWRRFIVPKKVEQINDYLFNDTYKSNKINILHYDCSSDIILLASFVVSLALTEMLIRLCRWLFVFHFT